MSRRPSMFQIVLHEDCAELQECSSGVCVCRTGYYMYNQMCYAELGSPSTPEQCDGLLSVVIDVSRSLTVDSCVIDEACHTFGVAARCGQPQDPWQMRNCECIPEDSVWDAERNLCRLFAELGESCQLSQECTGTDNAVCTNGTCSCSEGYQQIGDTCAPVIGGACLVNKDCAIANTVCKNGTTGRTCQCEDEFVAYEDICWEVANGFEANCTVSAQCTERLGKSSACVSSQCVCTHGNHHRDGSCWPVTELFSPCSRTSQCYLADLTDRTVCRNGLCQCDFDYPFSEELGTC
ncbi:unnamed protein product, partial [Leptidea sinapis]